jgi:arylsulfatase A-like enzyme
MSQLITDLRDRGLLDSTLVIWMGEFGRTPRINQRGAQPGRDHYPRAWSSVMVGGGIRAGQVVGKTDAEGATVTERPVSAIDFMATVCRLLGIDYTKMNQTPIGRPVRIADRGATPIQQIVG